MEKFRELMARALRWKARLATAFLCWEFCSIVDLGKARIDPDTGQGMGVWPVR